MRDHRFQGRGSPDTTWGRKNTEPEPEPEPQTLSDMIRQRYRERTNSQVKRAVRRERI